MIACWSAAEFLDLAFDGLVTTVPDSDDGDGRQEFNTNGKRIAVFKVRGICHRRCISSNI